MSCSSLSLLFFISLLIHFLIPASSEFLPFQECAPYDCGDQQISYPFRHKEQPNHCGYPGYELRCEGDNPTLSMGSLEYRAIHMDRRAQTLEVMVLIQRPAMDRQYQQMSFPYSHYRESSLWPADFTYPVSCASNSTHGSFAFFPVEASHSTENYSFISSCDSPISAPVDVNADFYSLISMNYSLGSAAGGALLMIVGVYIYRSRQRKKYGQSSFALRSTSSNYSSRTDFEEGSVYHGLPIFDYNDLKEATNDFDPAAELGDGGFGTVFKVSEPVVKDFAITSTSFAGKLRDGRVVAVKRLYESNYKTVEQFVNEVEILTRLHHPNLVSLYGCTSRQSRRLLLVYEYVPNGTVADHIHGDLAKPGLPPWSTRLKIAIETANALVYLHASDVIHRDVKTNNILLDENFTVKVADFGLSRLFPLNATHVSTAPQGTPGYVDPEYHQCYQLTEKSDVYSFGVVLMELISSLPAVDIMRHRHEINLSALAINKIQSHALHELVDQNLGFDTDNRTREMITAVAELGFRCLEEGHDMRPSMEEVLDTLKEIQNRGDNMEKSDQTDNISDDAFLLKNNPLTFSPVSVMAKWVSNDSTPNASG
ncbi:hypothetical protein EUGRSUZ_B00794 [Eucalyptus grandis]|uniref:Uncharacterized protein n=2 Tax=Eucalyptus grandis TaxID=71139 RepID=A0ACC3LNZ5_EUCGR|nr:hypothetical protein EUGRSUZ_B00794 [Eucalyptus grandis]